MGYLENGTEVAQKLYTQYGWSRNPIVAYLGNIQQESSIDPTNFQGADGDWSMGVGFNQWTPGTNLQEVAPCVGAWIETPPYSCAFHNIHCHSLRGSVD